MNEYNDEMIVEKDADANASMVLAQYARHPQESLDRLARRLAKKKWGKSDIVREDSAHAEEFNLTGEDKEFVDRYIIARIAEQHDKRAKAKQKVLRRAWELKHKGESFDAALPARMAMFRKYEDVPFGVYGNGMELKKYLEGRDSIADGEWSRYLDEKTAEQLDFVKSSDTKPSKEDLWRMYDIMQADARLSKKISGLGFGRSGDAFRRASIKLKVMELARVVRDGKKIRNNIAHTPRYVPSEHEAERALRQYADAEKKISEIMLK